MNNTSTSRRFLVREGLKDFMVWDRDTHGPALVDGRPVVGFSREHAIKIRDALNEPASAGEVRSNLATQTLMPSLVSPSLAPSSLAPSSLAPSHTEAKVRSGSTREEQTQFAEPLNYVESGIEKYGIRPGCPKCGMNMIVVNDVSLVPGKRAYECLRCGHVSGLDSPEARNP